MGYGCNLGDVGRLLLGLAMTRLAIIMVILLNLQGCMWIGMAAANFVGGAAASMISDHLKDKEVQHVDKP